MNVRECKKAIRVGSDQRGYGDAITQPAKRKWKWMPGSDRAQHGGAAGHHGLTQWRDDYNGFKQRDQDDIRGRDRPVTVREGRAVDSFVGDLYIRHGKSEVRAGQKIGSVAFPLNDDR